MCLYVVRNVTCCGPIANRRSIMIYVYGCLLVTPAPWVKDALALRV